MLLLAASFEPEPRPRHFPSMLQLETHYLADDGCFPNSRLPLLVYRRALPPEAEVMIEAFADNGWANAWQDGIFTYDHFHSTAHEVLGIARGEVRVLFGGPSGRAVTVAAGDVVVIPAGVAHRNIGQSDDLVVVGAYPGGADYDIRRGDPTEYAAAKAAAAAVSPRVDDPAGAAGDFLRDLWWGGGV